MKKALVSHIALFLVGLIFLRVGISANHFHDSAPIISSEYSVAIDHQPTDCSICSSSISLAEQPSPQRISQIYFVEIQFPEVSRSVSSFADARSADRAPPVFH